MPEKNFRVYISSGARNVMYTLRYSYDEPKWARNSYGQHVLTHYERRDYHIATLCGDRERAVEKAEKIIAEKDWIRDLKDVRIDLDASFDTADRAKSREIDHSLFAFGKYYGESVRDVLEKDFDYCLWAAENIRGKRHEKLRAILKAVPEVKAELDRQEAETREREAEREKAKESRASLFAEIADRLEDGKGGFRDSVAIDLREGGSISRKAEDIVCDILAKQMGRRNSKAYDEEFDRIEDVFEKVGEV